MKFTEYMLESYSQPLSPTERTHCQNAIRMVSDALKLLGFTDNGEIIRPLVADTYAYTIKLLNHKTNREIKLFIQGSYANNTNVRTQSDVDIAVIQEEVFIPEYRPTWDPQPQSHADYSFITPSAPAREFKDEVEECLRRSFGSYVERKDKSIKVHGNTYRKDADTVPCRRYRDYRKDFRKDETNYIGGIVIFTDSGKMIINYPEQHIENGRKKNTVTFHHYKKMVRIIKTMRYLMEESKNIIFSSAAKGVSSFVLESLLWNIEDQWYLENCRDSDKISSFSKMISCLRTRKPFLRAYKEANGIKPLCENEEAYEKLCTFIDALAVFFEHD